jgi:hypothetical protein
LNEGWNGAAMLASPWFASVHALLRMLPADRFPTLDELNELARRRGVKSGGGMPLEFVPASASASAQQYEVGIHDTGRVETRADSWHDTFNALVWLSFPRTKPTLNRVHRDELERLGNASPTRGTARDVATLFDEGGVIVACTDPSLAEALRTFRWRELFWLRRAEVEQCMRFLVFGHAILEHALAPHKAVTAKALMVDVDRSALALAESSVASLDAAAAAHFDRPEARASTHTLHPVPVLGIPGWTPDNAAASYYDDTAVFRPGRKRQAPSGTCLDLGNSLHED